MSTVLVSGADERYGYHLLNLIGSVRANSDVFDRVVAFDLGLTPRQRRLLDAARGVEVREVEPFAPHWREGRSWKPWAWTHVEAERLFWLDAGITVLRPLDAALAQIDELGYFVVSQGHPIRDSIPSDYYELYGFPRDLGGRVAVAAGIIGFRRGSTFYERVIVPTYEDALGGLALGFSQAELDGRNIGVDRTETPIVRDCAHFRWDQTILNLRFYLGVEDPVVADLDEYAGWRSAHDHPRQVIWSHRRRGSMAYLARVPYERGHALRGRAFGLVYRVRWWRKLHERLFERTTYVLKARRIVRGLSGAPGRARR